MTVARKVISIGVVLSCVLILVGWLTQSESLSDGKLLLHGVSKYLPFTENAQDELNNPLKQAQHSGKTTQEWEDWLFNESSMRNASMDGDWGHIGPNGLSPSIGLRQRFDQLGMLLGELNEQELRQLILSLTQRDLGELSASVMTLWDQYNALSEIKLQTTFDINNPDQLKALFDERQLARQRILGVETAKVFFADEDALFLETIQKLKNPPQIENPTLWGAPAANINSDKLNQLRIEKYGEDVAKRLAALDREEKEWAQSIANAQSKWNQLKAQPELSEIQLNGIYQQWLNENFPSKDHLRVKSLVGV